MIYGEVRSGAIKWRITLLLNDTILWLDIADINGMMASIFERSELHFYD